MVRGTDVTRNWQGWVVLVTAISTLIQFTAISLQKRRRFRALLLGDQSVGGTRSGRRRMVQIWQGIMRKQLQVCTVLLNDLASSPSRRILCPWYIKPCTIEWFYLYIEFSPQDDPERFRQFFRVTPALFRTICDLVREDLIIEPPEALALLPNRELVVERQVVVALWRLAIGDSILGISELFGISASSTSKICWKFIQSFSQRARNFISWPSGREMEEVKAGFSDKGFPNCCGAIDCTHILIELPVGEHSADYFDWKHNISITMQAVVDAKGRFMDVFIGVPGSTADARLLRLSGLYHDVVYEGTKLHGPRIITRGGWRLGEYLLGDGDYPLYKWLMVPFPRYASPETDQWNQYHSSARMCVERSFGQLKGVWRILSRTILRPKVNRLARTVFTCVLLHNMQAAAGENLPQQVWADIPPDPPGYGPHARPSTAFFEGGVEAREALYQEVMTRG